MALLKTLILSLAVLHFVSMKSSFSEAREYDVVSWQIPSSDTFDKWAQKNRFLIGDSIVFKYDGKVDSVLEVNEEDYKSCSRSKPIQAHNDGNTRITLGKSGTFFFISGADGHCEKGQKLQLRVLSASHHHHHSAPAPAPSPLANSHHGHSPAPAPAPAHHNGCASLRAGVLVSAAVAVIAALI